MGKVLLAMFHERPANISVVKMDEETDEFWDLVGGKVDFSRTFDTGLNPPDFEPQLFEVAGSGGYIKMKPLALFTQRSLINSDVYILDNWRKIFIWIGSDATKQEAGTAHRNVEKYIAATSSGRSAKDITVVEVEAGHEPPLFKVQFPYWDDNYAKQWLKTSATPAQQK